MCNSRRKPHHILVLTPKCRAKGKFQYPTAGLFSASLRMKIKIFFLLEIIRNDVNKHKMQLFPFRFHLTWNGNHENRLCIGERARREVAWRGFGSPQAVAYEWIRLSIVLPYADHLFSMTQTLLPHFCSNEAREMVMYLYKPHPAVN